MTFVHGCSVSLCTHVLTAPDMSAEPVASVCWKSGAFYFAFSSFFFFFFAAHRCRRWRMDSCAVALGDCSSSVSVSRTASDLRPIPPPPHCTAAAVSSPSAHRPVPTVPMSSAAVTAAAAAEHAHTAEQLRAFTDGEAGERGRTDDATEWQLRWVAVPPLTFRFSVCLCSLSVRCWRRSGFQAKALHVSAHTPHSQRGCIEPAATPGRTGIYAQLGSQSPRHGRPFCPRSVLLPFQIIYVVIPEKIETLQAILTKWKALPCDKAVFTPAGAQCNQSIMQVRDETNLAQATAVGCCSCRSSWDDSDAVPIAHSPLLLCACVRTRSCS